MHTKPILFTLFGVTGDLSRKKVIPALFHLFINDKLPKGSQIIGFGRRDWSRNDFEQLFFECLTNENHDAITDFLSQCHYAKGKLDSRDSFEYLHNYINELQKGHSSQLVFYYAVAPEFFSPISQLLHEVDLANNARIMIEKPFGHDLASAHALNTQLTEHFNEDQIYRIDHYLGKESVRNILAYRTQEKWSSDYIQKIEVELEEKTGVEGRGEYYDKAGETRDVLQNHALEILALTTLDTKNPDIPAARTEIIQSCVVESFKTGQYAGYHNDPEVAPNSTTETSIQAKLRIKNPTWEKLEVLISSGKKMGKKKGLVTVKSKDGSKKEFNITATTKDYETLLQECIIGDKTWFLTAKEVEACWQVVEPILTNLPKNIPAIYQPQGAELDLP